MYEVMRYTADDAERWNRFVAHSKQGTFLFDRNYMDYHANRFQDYSLMVFRKNCLFALLPANRVGDTLYSHQGLTYGGLVTDERAVPETVCEALEAINGHLQREGFRRVVYKPVPHIYHRLPAEEDVYALSLRCHARLVERDASATVLLKCPLKFPESRRSGIRKAQAQGVTVAESQDVDRFWTILTENLASKYDATPVHTAAEMKLLMARFPDNIRLYMAYDSSGVPLSGTVLYLTSRVVHTQYISASQEGKRVGALDMLFLHLLYEAGFLQDYFDFGTSAQADSNEVNTSLIFQKHGFGGRTVCYDWYEWELQTSPFSRGSWGVSPGRSREGFHPSIIKHR